MVSRLMLVGAASDEGFLGPAGRARYQAQLLADERAVVESLIVMFSVARASATVKIIAEADARLAALGTAAIGKMAVVTDVFGWCTAQSTRAQRALAACRRREYKHAVSHRAAAELLERLRALFDLLWSQHEHRFVDPVYDDQIPDGI